MKRIKEIKVRILDDDGEVKNIIFNNPEEIEMLVIKGIRSVIKEEDIVWVEYHDTTDRVVYFQPHMR